MSSVNSHQSSVAEVDPYDVCDEPDFCDCGAELIPYVNDSVECAVCHVLGCKHCLIPWDDCYDYLCPDCCPVEIEEET